jgi:hypothetical protein
VLLVRSDFSRRRPTDSQSQILESIFIGPRKLKGGVVCLEDIPEVTCCIVYHFKSTRMLRLRWPVDPTDHLHKFQGREKRNNVYFHQGRFAADTGTTKEFSGKAA